MSGAMSGCPFTHPLDLDAYSRGMPYEALAEARRQREQRQLLHHDMRLKPKVYINDRDCYWQYPCSWHCGGSGATAFQIPSHQDVRRVQH